VGANIPGLPGIVVGRTDHVAYGMTNAYGDTQDLYVETVDPRNPDRYVEGEKSLPFSIIEETLSIKDKSAPRGFREERVKIRLTRRGPVISGVLSNLKTDKVLTLRFAPFENMDPCLGLHQPQYCLRGQAWKHRLARYRKTPHPVKRGRNASFRCDGQRRQLGRDYSF
jgi:penicillin amidase